MDAPNIPGLVVLNPADPRSGRLSIVIRHSPLNEPFDSSLIRYKRIVRKPSASRVYLLATVAAKNLCIGLWIGVGREAAGVTGRLRLQRKGPMTENDRQYMRDVASIYDVIMGVLPDEYDTADILAALTLVLKDVALFHHGNLFTAQRASVVALDTSFMMEADRLVSSEIH